MDEFVFKVVLLGEKMTGKTSLIRRYVHSSFEGRYTGTIGLNVSNKRMKINHKGENYLVNLVIYDIEAESHFEDLFAPFAEGSVAAMFVVDVTRVVTLDAIDDWVNRLRKVIKSTALNNAILIGNKIDLVGEVKKTDAERVVEKYKMIQYLETSAKENKNVDLAFQVFSERILQMTLES